MNVMKHLLMAVTAHVMTGFPGFMALFHFFMMPGFDVFKLFFLLRSQNFFKLQHIVFTQLIHLLTNVFHLL